MVMISHEVVQQKILYITPAMAGNTVSNEIIQIVGYQFTMVFYINSLFHLIVQREVVKLVNVVAENSITIETFTRNGSIKLAIKLNSGIIRY